MCNPWNALMPRPQDNDPLITTQDWLLWSIIADYEEDNGNTFVVSALRWMVENKKRPMAMYNTNTKTYTFAWFGSWWYLGKDDDPCSTLPEERLHAKGNHHKSLREAVEWLAKEISSQPVPLVL